MVRHCIVKGCNNKGSEVAFFRFPALNSGLSESLKQLSLQRRQLWLSRLCVESIGIDSRVCEKHFQSGKSTFLIFFCHLCDYIYFVA